jgi:hypothetical protein
MIRVDEEDMAFLASHKWRIGPQGYLVRTVKGGTVLFHREILGLSVGDGIVVDHIDGDRLNNRRSNLRLCTRAENTRNQRLSCKNTSGYKGVTFNKANGKWTSQIMLNKKRKHLGSFNTPQEAYAAYCAAATIHHKEFANFGVTP